MVDKLSRYIKNSGKTYKDHYATLLQWYEKDEEELRKRKQMIEAKLQLSKNI